MSRARTGFVMFWKVMEIENAVFQDLESFRKEMIFYNDFGKVLAFCLQKFLTYPKMDVAYFCSKHRMCYVCLFCSL